ncbi:ABC transporter permease [Demequina soli]|uniref:ABC transporter permease n=1 Tax=Demequina soli TaxID=1638987 RepID=UPI000784A006|nr:ABC transporter permease [Demequina soli]
MTTPPQTTVGAIRDGSWQRYLTFSLSTWVTIGLLIVVTALNVALQPTFFTTYSLTSNFATFAPLVFAAVAQAVVVIGGGLDLSIGSIVALASVVALTVMDGEPSRVAIGVLAAIVTGVIAGAINGFIVGVIRLQPLIATFATNSVFAGAALVVLPKPGGMVPSTMTTGYRSLVIGIPVSVLIVVLAIVLYWLLSRTRLMRHIRAVGGDRSAAFASLVPVVRVQMASYIVAGAFAGLAALAILANTGSGDPFVGSSMALDSIAAVVLGGIALAGGRGSGIGAVAGAIILAMVSTVLSFMGVPTTWRQLASGVIIVAAIALSVVMSRKDQR